MNAESGAQEDEEQGEEIEVFSATLEGYESDNTLVAAIVVAQDGKTEANERATVDEMLQVLEKAKGVLVRKGDGKDIDAFRGFLLDIGQRVAEATEETWFSVGGKVSVAEQTILVKIEAVLSLPGG